MSAPAVSTVRVAAIRNGSRMITRLSRVISCALGAVGGVDADVFGGEIAGPVAGGGLARVKMKDDGDVVGEEFVAGGAFVEIEGLAAFENFDSGHGDFDERWIEFDAGAARGGEDAAPIGIAAGEGGFDERRSGNGL